MEDLYDNLENYNEEITITELQSENKELKFKLEEYGSTLEKLQKDFDKLSSEYKKLEQNYSSLLKTAKAEIERKTLIITNLNLEKDKMVLKSYHNGNVGIFRRKPYDKSKSEKDTKSGKDSKMKEIESGTKPLALTATDRKDQGNPPLQKDTSRSKSDIGGKLSSVANSGARQVDPRIDKNIDVKENVIQPKNENNTSKPTASIINRRKSMPAVSMQMDKMSTDDNDLASTGSFKDLSKEHTDARHMGRNLRDKQSSRISETSSLEDRNSGYHEPLSDAHKSKSYSRYDNDRTDRYRTRDKSSHRLKRHSPDRYQRGYKDYHDDPYHRSEPDKHKAHKDGHDDPYHRSEPDRQRVYNDCHYDPYHRSEPDRHRLHKDCHDDPYHRSEPDRQRVYNDCHDDPYHRSDPDRQRAIDCQAPDKYHWRRSREPHRNNGRSHHDHERQHRSQEKYPMKHKIQHRYDESDNKRMKMEQQYMQSVEDQRLQDERDFLEKKYLVEPFDNVQFPSCESPDYNHPISTQQIKEIKLTATTKLEDPRVCNKKYIVEKNNGRLALSTAEGRNVDIVLLKKTAWDIEPESMPEALVRRPSLEIEPAGIEIQMETENPIANLSMESGEICDPECLVSQNRPQEWKSAPQVDESKVLKTEGKQEHIKTVNQSKTVEKSSQKPDSYKIPKLKKTVDERQNRKNTKVSTLLEKAVLENLPRDKKQNSEDIIHNADETEPSINPKKQHETVVIHSNNELPYLGSSDLYDKQKYATAKEVVEGDLELSDDNCDNNEPPKNVSNVNVTRSPLENYKKDKNQSCNFETVTHSTGATDMFEINVHCNKINNVSGDTKHERVAVELCKDKVTKDGKKSKKKKSKHKECEMKDANISEKTTKRKEKVKETKTREIKSKFSELFDDSSSLIFPEDLGLTAVPTSLTKLPDKCVPFIEDAQDAVDLNAIKVARDSIPSRNPRHEEIRHGIVAKTKTDAINIINQEPMVKNNDMQPALTEEDNEVIYKNIGPGISEKEIVKTVIISTGVQPPMSIEGEKQELANKPKPQLNAAIQEVVLKGLATSTPHKAWKNVMQTDIEAKLPDTSSNSNDSQMASVANTPTHDIADTNTLDSQTNDTNVPDVRIFVRRRRKFTK